MHHMEKVLGRSLVFLLLACPLVGTFGFIPLNFVMYPLVLFLTGSETAATVLTIGTLVGLAWMLTLAVTAED